MSENPQEYFKGILLTVAGQAYMAAGYTLDEKPLQWMGGRFRFVKRLDAELFGFIEYQVLIYKDTEYAARMPSRFRVTLIRTDQHNPALTSDHPQFAQRDLSALVVDDFNVAILPSANHWWHFHNTDELGKALAEAGHLTIGYGMPWLAGELTPDENGGETSGE